MTPSREKWWSQLSDKEKYLRISIKACEADIKRHKHNLKAFPHTYKFSEFATKSGEQYLKQEIRQRKYILTALKHELERGGHTTIGSAQTGFNTVWGCTSCNTIIFVGSMGGHSYRYCPYCGRKIKEQE